MKVRLFPEELIIPWNKERVSWSSNSGWLGKGGRENRKTGRTETFFISGWRNMTSYYDAFVSQATLTWRRYVQAVTPWEKTALPEQRRKYRVWRWCSDWGWEQNQVTGVRDKKVGEMSLASSVWKGRNQTFWKEVDTAQGMLPKKCLDKECGGVNLMNGADIQIELNINHQPTILKTDYIKSPGFRPKIPKC